MARARMLWFFLGVVLSLTLPALSQAPTAGYSARSRNSDGSLRPLFYFGGGWNQPAGASKRTHEASWNYRMGGGYRFNRHVGVPLTYAFDHFRIPQSLVDAKYTPLYGTNIGVIGVVHLWSVGVEPILHYAQSEHVGGYFLAGVGFYRKLTTFEQPNCDATQQQCSFLGVSRPTRVLSNNAAGFSIGTGGAVRMSDHTNTKVFVEARYIWVNNKPSANNTFYPPANERIGYFPLTAGLRW